MVREEWKNFDKTFVWENDYIKQEQTIKNKNSTLQLSVTLWAENFIESEKLIFKCSSLISHNLWEVIANQAGEIGLYCVNSVLRSLKFYPSWAYFALNSS